jgi:hypothetical protein
MLCVHTGESARRWSAIKDKLAFCQLHQDGDDEGCLHLDHLPSADEAEAIRAVLHIRKRRHLSPEALAKARSTLGRFRSARYRCSKLDDGSYLSEPVAICRYLEGLQPEPSLLGRDLREQARE